MIKAKKEVKEEIKKEEKKEEFNLEEAFVLWKHEGKGGTSYLTGNTKEKVKLLGFFNKNKKNPKEPDVRIYTLDEEGNQQEEVCALWETESKSGHKYLSGNSEDDFLVAFYNDVDGNDKLPYIRAYYKNK
ncbi:MAG: hypothetical protein IKE91_06205 [Clostridia bacterium]|nr:hypothetical protein [Clostridia bacterium]